MIRPDEALRLVLKTVTRRAPRRVALAEARGLRLAEAICADRDYPPFARATMDGYAVNSIDSGRSVEVVGEIAAGQDETAAVSQGCCVEIMTGAPCPPGADAVVPKEDVRVDGDRITLPAVIPPGQFIVPRGSECRRGQTALEPGETITPLGVAVLASFGVQTVAVTPRPSLAVITTGAELTPTDQQPGAAMIRDSNGPMLSAMIAEMGIECTAHQHAEDRLDSILAALATAADRDVVLLTGGVSAGKYDLVPEALEQFGAELVFHKVTQKPGKPLLVASKNAQLIFGLPGNPLSCHFCFSRYVVPAVRQMAGMSPETPLFEGVLAKPIEPKSDRTYFVPARAERIAAQSAGWRLHPLRGASSGDIFTPCRANCYAEVPPGEDNLLKDHILTFTWLPDTSPDRC